jgi:hypothetical protein
VLALFSKDLGMPTRNYLIIATIALPQLMSPATILAETAKGPSSSASPYVINVAKNVDVTSVLTVGDTVNDKPDSITPYRMVGIPDGLGAFDNYDGTFTILMNHELPENAGIPRQHGFSGAFVSSWIVRKSDLTVLHGGDLAKQVFEWDSTNKKFVPADEEIGRLCSADLPQPSALYSRSSGKGFIGRIFMDGEEVGPDGRAFAHVVSGPGAGISYELPSLGKFSWENALASPYEQDRTIVIGTDDNSATQLGQVYVYVGQKQAEGNEVEKAGLHGGSLYGVRIVLGKDSLPLEGREDWIRKGESGRFELHNLGDVSSTTGDQIQSASVSNLVTEFRRPEDGAWDTHNPNVFYFTTTDRFDTTKDGSGGAQVARSRLHRLTFDDIRQPEKGGRYDVLLDGTEPQQMLDNLTVDGDGNLILQEDPGNQAVLARIWKFYPSDGRLVEIAKHDPKRFGDRNVAIIFPPTPPFSSDEESSGIIEITQLFRKNSQGFDWDRLDSPGDDAVDERWKWVKGGYRYYLAVTQAHYAIGDPELVEGGQLFIIAVPKNVR